MENLVKFLKSQKLLVIASRDEKDLWIANVYFGFEDGKFYFISRENTKHSRMILKNPEVAFSVCWFDSQNHKNRKAVQGLGKCYPTNSEEEIETGVKLHNQNFPEFADRINIGWIYNNEYNSKVWILKPTYMKYWDDKVYGENGEEEFSFLN